MKLTSGKTFATEYANAVADYVLSENALAERKKGLYDLAARTPAQGTGSWASERARVRHAANASIASDPDCQDYQTKMDRAAQRAIMHGIGALLERLSR